MTTKQDNIGNMTKHYPCQHLNMHFTPLTNKANINREK